MTERGPTSTLIAAPRAGVVVLRDAVVQKGWVDPRRAGVLRAYGVPVLAVAALVWLAVAVLRFGGPAQPQVYADFPDGSRGSYLDVQLNRSVASFGAFSAWIPGEGRVWPAERVRATPDGARAVRLHYDGAGYRDRAARPDGDPVWESPRQAQARTPVLLRLDGRVDPADLTASVDLWVDGTHHRIDSASAAGGAEDTVRAFLDAVSAHDWNRLYGISDRYMRNGVKQEEFTNGIGSGAAGRISAVEAEGPTTYSTTEAGARVARTPVRLTYGMGTGETSVRADLVLVFAAGAWRVFSLQ